MSFVFKLSSSFDQTMQAKQARERQSLVFLYSVQTPLWMSVCMSVTYISSLSFDAKKKKIGALNRGILCQEYNVPDF